MLISQRYDNFKDITNILLSSVNRLMLNMESNYNALLLLKRKRSHNHRSLLPVKLKCLKDHQGNFFSMLNEQEYFLNPPIILA